MHRLTISSLDYKGQIWKYGVTLKYCIGVCNIFAWIGYICIGELSSIFGGIFQAMEHVVPLVGSGLRFKSSWNGLNVFKGKHRLGVSTRVNHVQGT
jgi:hypothetical protein